MNLNFKQEGDRAMWQQLLSLLVIILTSTADISTLADKPGIRAAAFSHDGKLFAACSSSGSSGGELAVWDAQTWKLKFIHREQVGFPRLAFSPDSKVLALSRYAPETNLFDVESGKRIGQLKGHTNHASCVEFTPDGSQIITGSYDRSVKIWDAKTRELLHTIADAGSGNLYHVDVSPDGKLLVVADGREYIYRLFDLDKREQVFASKRMGSLVPHVTFTPDGSMVAVSSWGGYCRLYDIETGELNFELMTNSADWSSVSKSGMIAVAAQKSVYVYAFLEADESTKTRIEKLITDFEQNDYGIRESASTELKNLGGVVEPFLATAMHSKIPEVRMRTRRVRDFLMKTDSAKELKFSGEAECAVFSPVGNVLVTGDKHGNLVVWNVGEWTQQREFQIPR